MPRGSGPTTLHKPFWNVTTLFYLKQQRLLPAQLERVKKNLPVPRINLLGRLQAHNSRAVPPENRTKGQNRFISWQNRETCACSLDPAGQAAGAEAGPLAAPWAAPPPRSTGKTSGARATRAHSLKLGTSPGAASPRAVSRLGEMEGDRLLLGCSCTPSTALALGYPRGGHGGCAVRVLS